ncbi:TetR/AcrR family transcriptional regulator [Limnobacter sp.]|uniref:TetR/AcrR family transcriptional regulator n=1 Tax=Limnobacter profundi TaxID=2732163 RepID=A0ABX6N6W6_9BURK|nr:TetR/AcrR family transcriptional regulator [Limnobacter sp. SAORIC-580]
MGTRKVPKEQRMSQILDVAGSVFSRHGFHSTSMEQIAEGAGVTKPLLYRYFGSKDALYLATITQVGNHLMSGLTLLMANPNPKERLKLIMLSFLTFVERHREGWSVLYNEALTSVGPVGEKVAFFRNSFIEASAKTIEELNDPSKAKSSDKAGIQAVALANIMVGAVEAGARWWIQHPEIPIRDMQKMIETSLMPGLSER